MVTTDSGRIIMTSMKDMDIHHYKKLYLHKCRELWKQLTVAHREIYDDPAIGGQNPGIHFDSHLNKVGKESLWVAKQDGYVIGLVGLRDDTVEPVILDNQHRGKGIGTALVEFAICEAQKRGIQFLSVKPVARNKDAIEFFHMNGFQTIGHVDLFIDLKPELKRGWKKGISLFGNEFNY
jgi:GNAT superfamily N-acetyltransferase